MSASFSKETYSEPTAMPVLAGKGLLQRKCSCGNHTVGGAECEACSKQSLQRRAIGRAETDAAPPIVHEVLSSSGHPLDTETRSFMESRFHQDFSHVRVHTDERAAQSASAVNASAYTVGRDVVFDTGRYAPRTAAGRKLLAHELAHVVQQSHMGGGQQLASQVSHPSDPAESEADRVAAEVVSGLTVGFDRPMSGIWSPPDKSVYKPSERSASSAVLYRKFRPWPFNGYVINNSSKPVTVWSDSRKIYTIAAGATSGRFNEDVDHIKDEKGQWYKIGPHTVTVDKNGKLSGYECAVSNFGEDCPKAQEPSLQKPERSLTPAVSTGVTPRR